MAEKLDNKGLNKSLGVPLCLLAVVILLLIQFTGTPCDRKTSAPNPETTQDARVMNSAADIRLPVSHEADLQKNDPSAKTNNHAKLLDLKNNWRRNDDRAHQADDAGDRLPAGEDAAFLDEESVVDSEGALYTEAQLNELDPETRRLVAEEIRQAQEYQPTVGAEFYQEEMDRSLAEEAAALEEERLLDPEGNIYTEAELDELDPETRRLVEEEIRGASE